MVEQLTVDWRRGATSSTTKEICQSACDDQ